MSDNENEDLEEMNISSLFSSISLNNTNAVESVGLHSSHCFDSKTHCEEISKNSDEITEFNDDENSVDFEECNMRKVLISVDEQDDCPHIDPKCKQYYIRKMIDVVKVIKENASTCVLENEELHSTDVCKFRQYILDMIDLLYPFEKSYGCEKVYNQLKRMLVEEVRKGTVQMAIMVAFQYYEINFDIMDSDWHRVDIDKAYEAMICQLRWDLEEFWEKYIYFPKIRELWKKKHLKRLETACEKRLSVAAKNIDNYQSLHVLDKIYYDQYFPDGDCLDDETLKNKLQSIVKKESMGTLIGVYTRQMIASQESTVAISLNTLEEIHKVNLTSVQNVMRTINPQQCDQLVTRCNGIFATKMENLRRKQLTNQKSKQLK